MDVHPLFGRIDQKRIDILFWRPFIKKDRSIVFSDHSPKKGSIKRIFRPFTKKDRSIDRSSSEYQKIHVHFQTLIYNKGVVINV